MCVSCQGYFFRKVGQPATLFEVYIQKLKGISLEYTSITKQLSSDQSDQFQLLSDKFSNHFHGTHCNFNNKIFHIILVTNQSHLFILIAPPSVILLVNSFQRCLKIAIKWAPWIATCHLFEVIFVSYDAKFKANFLSHYTLKSNDFDRNILKNDSENRQWGRASLKAKIYSHSRQKLLRWRLVCCILVTLKDTWIEQITSLGCGLAITLILGIMAVLRCVLGVGHVAP